MQVFEYVKQEWVVLKGAPLSFVGLAAVFFVAGISIGAWHYSERLDTKDGEIHRYRVAMGIDAASQGALVELSNQELELKAQFTVSKLRALHAELNNRLAAIQTKADEKKITQAQLGKDQWTVRQEVAQDFDSNLASDAHNVDEELRRRLDPKAIAHVVRVPALVSADGSRIPITALFKGDGPDTFFIIGLADEIEQMAKLLPR
jgi:hypothetical protein